MTRRKRLRPRRRHHFGPGFSRSEQRGDGLRRDADQLSYEIPYDTCTGPDNGRYAITRVEAPVKTSDPEEIKWVWDGTKLLWSCTMVDGTVLRAVKSRHGWVAEVETGTHVHKSHRVHVNADLAQDECWALLQVLVARSER